MKSLVTSWKHEPKEEFTNHGWSKESSAPNYLRGASPGSLHALCTYQQNTMIVTELYGVGEGIGGLHHGCIVTTSWAARQVN